MYIHLDTMQTIRNLLRPVSFPIDSTPNLFYNMKELLDYNPDFFRGCKYKPRGIIERKSIPVNEYVYANYIKKTQEWKIADCGDKSKKANLLLRDSWVERNFFINKIESPIFKEDNISIEFINESDILSPKSIEIIDENVEPIDEDITESPDGCQINFPKVMPNLLELEEFEKFYNDKGVVEIETRGERNQHSIFFRLKDVSKAFDILNLKSTVLHKENCVFEKDIHYVSFIKQNTVLNQHPNINKSIKKHLYLTYEGIIKVCLTSRNKNSKPFRDWATKLLYTHQMGNTEEKQEVAAKLLNTDVRAIQQFFNACSNELPCVYLFSLGKVKDLRESFDISSEVNDDLIVYKYGHTTNMVDRHAAHKNDYGKINNVVLTLVSFCYIDPRYTAQAENDIRLLFKETGLSLKIKGRNELVAFNDTALKLIKSQYKNVGQQYAGFTEVLQNKIIKLENDIINKDKDIENTRLLNIIELNEKNKIISENILMHTIEINNKDSKIRENILMHINELSIKDKIIEEKERVIHSYNLRKKKLVPVII